MWHHMVSAESLAPNRERTFRPVPKGRARTVGDMRQAGTERETCITMGDVSAAVRANRIRCTPQRYGPVPG